MGLRLKFYDKTFTSGGRQVSAVWMDQYGRILEKKRVARLDSKGRRMKDVEDWVPTGECGVANH